MHPVQEMGVQAGDLDCSYICVSSGAEVIATSVFVLTDRQHRQYREWKFSVSLAGKAKESLKTNWQNR